MVDMFPTLAQLAGLPEPQRIPGSEGINGTSLVPALLDPGNATNMKLAGEYRSRLGRQHAINTQTQSLIQHPSLRCVHAFFQRSRNSRRTTRP
eukprot:COSAG02_NODE_49114_length_329_cov_0.613043_1_plen_92_part_10